MNLFWATDRVAGLHGKRCVDVARYIQHTIGSPDFCNSR